MNLSTVSADTTARTCSSAAAQRAEHLAMLGVRSVLELCVGPSLRELEAAYAAHDIAVAGNDIDPQWKRYYPRGRWLIGDAFTVDCSGFDAVVFAPPLSHGCTGTRADSLSVSEVKPAYSEFMRYLRDLSAPPAVAVLVLPGRAMATRRDRAETFALLAQCGAGAAVIPLTDLRGRVVKYHDVYLVNGRVQRDLFRNSVL